MPSFQPHNSMGALQMMSQNPLPLLGNEDIAMDGLANLQPETVELPDLKDYQTMYRMDQ